MDLGNKIQNLRKKQGLSQEELANQIGVTRQTISKWELNETSPDINQAKKIKDIFKISLDELVNHKNTDSLNSKSNVEILAGIMIKILKWIAIGLVVVPILAIIISFILYLLGSPDFKVETLNNYTEETINCIMNNNKFTYGLKYNENNEIIELYEDNTLTNILDLEQYEYADQVREKIYNYFETNNGSCN